MCVPSAHRAAAALAWLLVTSGCASIPSGRSAIDEVTILGAERLDEDAVKGKIATAESPKFLGLFRGLVYDYETLDRIVLQRDMARVERYYRARGFYDARASVARIVPKRPQHVRVEIVVSEGEPVLVRQLRVDGLAGLPPDIAEEALEAARERLPIGKPFDEDAFAGAEWSIQRALTDRGYAYAKVTRDAAVDVVAHQADVQFVVEPDVPAVFGPVHLEGLGDLPERAIRRALDLGEGEPYSTEALDDARQAVLDLGVVSSVVVTPELAEPRPAPRVIPVRVRVEPAPLRSLELGGGVELDALKTDIHAVIGWQDKNLLGNLRSLRVMLRPGLVLHPMRINNFVGPTDYLFEGRFLLELRQPGVLEARTNAFIRPEIEIVPMLVKTQTDPDDPVVGYREFHGTTGLDRTFGKAFGQLTYNVQVEQPFTYVGDLDPALRTLLISYPELVTTIDLRDDRIRPHAGAYFATTLQLAGLGGDARDLKLQPEARAYVPLSPSLTLAGRTTVGLLFPSNYGSYVRDGLDQPYSDGDRAARVRDLQIVFFRGFFSGGPSSNRGYPHRTIAPHGVVPFLSPAMAAAQIAELCSPDHPDYDPARCSIPVGGFTLWETSLEVRWDVAGPFSTAVFCDASDVAPRTTELRLDYPHLSCGLGARYDTPVGPVRLDVGYRIPGAQVPARANEQLEGDPGEVFGAPIAIAFGIGEAF